MNKKYWEDYYSNLLPSNFAKFCVKYLKKNSKIVDVGCGNGRDSYYFSSLGFNVCGVDYALKPYNNNVIFKKLSVNKLVKSSCIYDIVYSRFFLHSIKNKEIINLINWTKNIFIAEFRDISDKPKIYKNHIRNLIDGEWVKNMLINKNFKIIYYKKSKNLAKYKNENPTIVRIIAKKI